MTKAMKSSQRRLIGGSGAAAALQLRLMKRFNLVGNGNKKNKVSNQNNQLGEYNNDMEFQFQFENDCCSFVNWNAVEQQAIHRIESSCPICMISFVDSKEVLLSCSHVFHHQCITSFEKFASNGKDKFCPICRLENYEKKDTAIGSHCFRVLNVLKIQAIVRGHLVRKVFHRQLHHHYQQQDRCGIKTTHRKKFYERELVHHTNLLTNEMKAIQRNVDDLIDSVDVNVMEVQELENELTNMLLRRGLTLLDIQHIDDNNNNNENNEDNEGVDQIVQLQEQQQQQQQQQEDEKEIAWSEVLRQACERNAVDCAICLDHDSMAQQQQQQQQQRQPQRQHVLLSCSHVFHERCVNNLELYCQQKAVATTTTIKRACPICRYHYSKRLIYCCNSSTQQEQEQQWQFEER